MSKGLNINQIFKRSHPCPKADSEMGDNEINICRGSFQWGILPSVAVRVEPLGLGVCILSGIEPEQLVEGPGASLSSEVEAWWEDDEDDDLTDWGWTLPEVVGTTERSVDQRKIKTKKNKSSKVKKRCSNDSYEIIGVISSKCICSSGLLRSQ